MRHIASILCKIFGQLDIWTYGWQRIITVLASGLTQQICLSLIAFEVLYCYSILLCCLWKINRALDLRFLQNLTLWRVLIFGWFLRFLLFLIQELTQWQWILKLLHFVLVTLVVVYVAFDVVIDGRFVDVVPTLWRGALR